MSKYYKKENILKTIFYYLALFSFLKPPAIDYIFPSLKIIINVIKIITCFMLFLLVIKKGYSKIINYIILFSAILLFSTIFNGNDYNECIKLILTFIGLSLLIDYGFRNDTKLFLNIFELLLYVFIIVNFLTILIYKNGMYLNELTLTGSNWFLGFKNNHINYIMPAILISLINTNYQYKKITIRNIILLTLGTLTIFLVNSSTAKLGVLIVILLLTGIKMIEKLKKFNIFNYTMTYILVFIGIVIVRIQNIFSFIIVDILKKDITLTGRVHIWDSVIENIKYKPLLGYGKAYEYTAIVSSAHNQFLDIAYRTGVLGLISFIMIIYMSFKEVWKYKKEKVAIFISIIIFSYLIMMISEAYSLEYIIYLFVICYNIKQFINYDKGDKYEN